MNPAQRERQARYRISYGPDVRTRQSMTDHVPIPFGRRLKAPMDWSQVLGGMIRDASRKWRRHRTQREVVSPLLIERVSPPFGRKIELRWRDHGRFVSLLLIMELHDD